MADARTAPLGNLAWWPARRHLRRASSSTAMKPQARTPLAAICLLAVTGVWKNWLAWCLVPSLLILCQLPLSSQLIPMHWTQGLGLRRDRDEHFWHHQGCTTRHPPKRPQCDVVIDVFVQQHLRIFTWSDPLEEAFKLWWSPCTCGEYKIEYININRHIVKTHLPNAVWPPRAYPQWYLRIIYEHLHEPPCDFLKIILQTISY